MADVTTEVANIRAAILGIDVRESIASGIESINTEVVSTTAKEAVLEGQFNSLVINAGSSNAEIVAGRTSSVTAETFDTMGHRADGVDAQLVIETAARLSDKDDNVTQLALKTNQTDFTALLQDTAVSPEQFIGTDFQKLQQALDYGVINSVEVKLRKVYNITGLGTLLINKPQNYSPNTNRKPLFITGVGGGIKKTDVGYVFSSTLVDVGDIFLTKVKFESIEGIGTTIFDGNKLINIFSSDCYYLNCDGIAEANTTYAQGWDFQKNVIVGGKGWAFSFSYGWAVTIIDNVIEWRQHGIGNIGAIENVNNGLKINGNTIEGLTGEPISINGSSAFQFSGNYFEANIGSILIKSPCEGAEISTNFIELSAAQITGGTAGINLPSGLFFSKGNKSNGVLFSMVANTTVYSENDSAVTLATGVTTSLYQSKRDIDAVTFAGGVIKKYGACTLYEANSSPTLNASEVRTIDIPMPGNIYDDDHISVRLSSPTSIQSSRLVNFSRLDATTVRVVVENMYSGGTLGIIIHVTVLRVGNSSYYG